MRKVLILIGIAAICSAVAIRYFHPDFSWISDASSGENGPIADMDQPLRRTVVFSLDQRWVDLSTYKGQVVLIEFFAKNRQFSVDGTSTSINFPVLFGDKGFTVVAIAIDDQGEETVESFAKNRQFSVDGTSTSINFPVLTGSAEIAQKLGFEGGLPAGVLVNRDGKEVKIIRGVVSEAALSKAIQKLLRN